MPSDRNYAILLIQNPIFLGDTCGGWEGIIMGLSATTHVPWREHIAIKNLFYLSLWLGSSRNTYKIPCKRPQLA